MKRKKSDMGINVTTTRDQTMPKLYTEMGPYSDGYSSQTLSLEGQLGGDVGICPK